MKKTTIACTLVLALLQNWANAHTTQVEPEVALKMLNEHNKQFEKKVYKVSNNVYTAVGYHGATTSMIVGSDGVIIIDTLMGPKPAQEAYDAMRKASKTNKPVKAIILTHSHADHIGGAKVFAGDNKNIPIYAAENFGIAEGVSDDVAKIKKIRNIRQFGRMLPKEEQTNRGVAPSGTYDKDAGKGFLEPTIRIKENVYKTSIAGVELEFYRISGETDDALFIWLPKNKVLFAGDNFYQAFPNLYAIRGTGYRNVLNWANSALQMANMNPEFVVAGHTTPMSGKKAREALRAYGEAIKYIYNETIKGMNQGKSVDILVQEIKLPKNLQKPYLTEFYGSIPHSIRNIYVGLLGWFDGNPTTLNPLPQKQKAQKIAQLSGGVKKLEQNLQEAIKNEEYQWALELADTIKWLDGANKKLVVEAKIKALRGLAKREFNAPNRNYYLSYANELESGKLNKIWH